MDMIPREQGPGIFAGPSLFGGLRRKTLDQRLLCVPAAGLHDERQPLPARL